MNKPFPSSRIHHRYGFLAVALLITSNAWASTASDTDEGADLFAHSHSFNSVAAVNVNELSSSGFGMKNLYSETGIAKISQALSALNVSPISQKSFLLSGDPRPSLLDVTPSDYAYDLSPNLAPVPATSEWVMILAGLGMIGFIIRRRANIQ